MGSWADGLAKRPRRNALKQLCGDVCPSLGAHHALRVYALLLRSEQNSIPHAAQVNEDLHAIVDEVRHTKALADRPLVWPFPAEVKRPGIKRKHVEQFVMCEPESGLFLGARAALRNDADALTKSFAPKPRQRIEGASDCWRFQKSIREKRGVRAVGSYAIDEDTANIDPQ